MPSEILPFANCCPDYRILLAEFALDFDHATRVDSDFIKRVALFGKSRPKPDRGGKEQLRYGTRSSAKLVRSYEKAEIDRYRVELELHGGLLRPQGIRQFPDLPKLCRILFPSHLQFVSIRWSALGKYLSR